MIAAIAAGCVPFGGPELPDPLTGTLPEVPFRAGPLELDVVYPEEGASLTARDTTFIFGSTGTGRARLAINGEEVRVWPNGAFLAFLPVPENGVYRLLATAPGDTAQLTRMVEVPPPPPSLPRDSAVILTETISPRGAWAVLPDEAIEVSFRGSPGGRAALLLPDGTRVTLVEEVVFTDESWGLEAFGTGPAARARERVGGLSEYSGFFVARPVVTTDTTVAWPRLAMQPRAALQPPVADVDTTVPVDAPDSVAMPARAARTPGLPWPGAAVVELVVDGDTARAPLPLNMVLVDPDRARVGVARDTAAVPRTGSGAVIGRPAPGYVYHYFWPNGTKFTLTGERNGYFRVSLGPELNAWVDADEVRLEPPGTPPPGGRVGTVRMTPYSDAVDVRFSLEERIPFRVDEGERTISVTLYGGASDTNWLQYGGIDPLIQRAAWVQLADSVYRLNVHLTKRPWGWRVFWGGDGDLVVRIRRPPPIDPDDPLEGLLIAVDAGHPPGGAIGPTRLEESEANLAIALELAEALRDEGARVLLTRTDTAAVPLYARPREAAEAGADLLVSVHNNAFPGGVNPFRNAGTSVYYNRPHSAALAGSLQQALVDELGLRDLGIGRADLALARPTWMPAALTETMFLMIPRQEAALRNAEVIERIADAHVRGIRRFLIRYGRN